ncbi:MAG: NADH-quinone oxidoreductase subunit C [Planctomycetes bacterium]|nr:NADH-quinone oxidoreductase subunit C [Planctomycetota bacterium]
MSGTARPPGPPAAAVAEPEEPCTPPPGTRVSRDALQAIQERFGDAVLGADLEGTPAGGDPWLRLDPRRLVEVCAWCRDDSRFAFDLLSLVSGVDYPEGDDKRIEVVYHLDSTTRNHWLVLKVWCDRADARVPSLTGVWPTADWHERETWDLLGVRFEGHPHLARILCDPEWVGHPLRRDYVFPGEFRGIPCVTE